MTAAVPRRSGVKLDVTRLDHEMAKRGVSARELAPLAGVTEETLSRWRHGRALSQRNLRALGDALLALPVQPGCALLLADPDSSPRQRGGPAPSNGTTDNATIEQTDQRDKRQ